MTLDSFFSERLVIEFDVAKTVDVGYGIQEKYLIYRGERTRYKAIVKDGRVVAIVTTRYKVVPNEAVLEILERAIDELGWRDKFSITKAMTDTRMWWRAETDQYGVLVTNSIDGTLALKVMIMMHRVPLTSKVYETLHVEPIYRRHFERLNAVKFLPAAMTHVRDFYINHGRSLVSVLEKKADREFLEAVRSAIPKKYTVGLEALLGRPCHEMVSAISRKIWSAELDPLVRVVYLERFANVLWSYVLVDF